MDPSAWGPLTWSLIFDICHNMDNKKLNQKQTFAVKVFFLSLQYLLPCKYCRESYCKYLKELDGEPNCQTALEWAFILKNKVNDKLGKKDRITYEKFVKRMKTYQSCASQSDVLDILFIMGVNYMADIDKPKEHKQKKAWFWLMINKLPVVLELLPQQKQLAKALSKIPARRQDIRDKNSVISYLCDISKNIDGRSRTVDKMCKKYQNAKNRDDYDKPGDLISPR